MEEKLVTFKNRKGERLFGILTLPKLVRKVSAVILVHGFGKTKSERKFVELARKLTENGIASFRFDFSGCGDSEGKFEEMSITKEVEELNATYRRLIREKVIDRNRIGIFAHSLGTVIAALFQQKYGGIKYFVLCAPAFNQKRLIKKWYTGAQIKEWKKKGYLDTLKFRVGLGYLDEARDYTELLTQIKIPTFILHGEKDEEIPAEMAKETFKRLKIKEKKVAIIPEGDHHFESYPSRQKLVNYSIKWFRQYLERK